MNKIITIILLPLLSIFAYSDSSIQKYKVKEKDNLYSIALRYYKNGEKWNLIYMANSDKIKDPDLIYPDMILDIPLYSVKENKNDEMVNLNNELTISTSLISSTTKSFALTDIVKSSDISSKNEVFKSTFSIEKKDLRQMEYRIKEKEMSEDIPLSLSAFNTGWQRIEVGDDFFDGEVVNKTDKIFFEKGERVSISLFRKALDYNKCLIYVVVSRNENINVVDKIGEGKLIKDGDDYFCVITAASTAVEDGMKVKLWK